MTLSTGNQLSDFSRALNERYDNFVLEAVRDVEAAAGSFRSRALGGISLAVVDVRQVVSRRQKLNAGLQELVSILAPLRGRLVIDQYGRTTELVPGEVAILDSAAACSLVVEAECRALSVDLDRRSFDRFGGTTRLCNRRIRVGDRIGGLFPGILVSLTENIDRYEHGDSGLIEDLLVPVIGRIATGDNARAPRGRGDVSTHRMEEWVRTNIHDSGLSVDRLAEEFGFTRRGIFRHFAAMDTTPARWLWNIRLQCADEKLNRWGGSVSEIAYSVGFNDSSHFARLYKHRFGQQPTVRRRSKMLQG